MNLTVSLIQANLLWEDAEGNRRHLTQKIEQIGQATDVIVLPETFTSGFSMQPQKLAESVNGPTTEWMALMAAKHNAVICGTIFIEEDGAFYNRFIWMMPNGEQEYYNKRHGFSMANEDKHFAQGQERVIIVYKGWRIMPQICYDLRFPVWSRNDLNYDCLIYVANWPNKRAYHWQTLLKARAIENQCYALAVNRVGKDGNDFDYKGDSAVIDPAGNTIAELAYTEGIFTTVLSKQHLKEIRTQFPFLQDMDGFGIV